MDISRHASPAVGKFPSTSLHDDLVKVLPHPEFVMAMCVAPAIVTLLLLVAGDDGALDRVAAAVNVPARRHAGGMRTLYRARYSAWSSVSDKGQDLA